MHTYKRVADNAEDSTPRWQTGILADGPTSEQILKQVGPDWKTEAEAACFAAYLNGSGKWAPDEVAGVLPPPEQPEAPEQQPKTHTLHAEAGRYGRPPGMDYPPEDTKSKAKAKAARHKGAVKRAHPKAKAKAKAKAKR